jgi:peptidyl-prolyl cis-trans isomerase A (cyclophilin A)
MMVRCMLALLISGALTAFAEDAQKSSDDSLAEGLKKLEALKKAQADKMKDGQQQPKTVPANSPTATLTIEQGGQVLGDIVIALNEKKAPITVLNFADYIEAGYYDGTIFHRVIPTFMIQGGGFTPEIDKKTDGLKNPIKNEWGNGLKNKRGTIAMARLGGNPDSATSQFFINVVDNKNLDARQRDGAGYCVFGEVVSGMDVVDKIRDTGCEANPKYPGGEVVPTTPVVIKSATIAGLDRKALEKTVADQEAAMKAAQEAEQQQLREFAETTAKELGKELGKTDSGIYYIILKEGDGISPTPADQVTVHYKGTFLDGNEFDSSYKRGQPATFPLRGVIKGWTEGVSLMKVGETRKLMIPWKLAYGERGRGSIPPKADLVFDIELIEVVGK